MSDWQPMNDNVVMELLDKPPEHFLCRVVAVGPGTMGYNGIRIPTGVAVGDIVYLRRHAAHWFLASGEKLLLARAYHIRMKGPDTGQKPLF